MVACVCEHTSYAVWFVSLLFFCWVFFCLLLPSPHGASKSKLYTEGGALGFSPLRASSPSPPSPPPEFTKINTKIHLCSPCCGK